MNSLIYPNIFPRGVTAFFTGKNPGADPDRLSALLGIRRDKVFLPFQNHGDKVVLLDENTSSLVGDAVITNLSGVLVGIVTADCVPILLFSEDKQVFGAVHAGWRGTSTNILMKALDVMIEKYCCNPNFIGVAIGPSIRWCCYEVGYDVFASVSKSTGKDGYFRKKGDKYCLDLAEANRYQALQMGILQVNVWMSDNCTYCSPDKFYSYRHSKILTGRQGGFIGLL